MAKDYEKNILPLFENKIVANREYQGTISEMMIATELI